MKTCFKCGVEKLPSEFYVHPQMGDGRLGKCKECAKRDVRENRARRREYYNEFDRQRASDPKRVKARAVYVATVRGRAVMFMSRAKWEQANPHKKRCTTIVGNAIRDGRLKKKPCEKCGATGRVHAHHDDYSKPLSVRWLCSKHHSEHHKLLREMARKDALAKTN